MRLVDMDTQQNTDVSLSGKILLHYCEQMRILVAFVARLTQDFGNFLLCNTFLEKLKIACIFFTKLYMEKRNPKNCWELSSQQDAVFLEPAGNVDRKLWLKISCHRKFWQEKNFPQEMFVIFSTRPLIFVWIIFKSWSYNLN